MTEDSKIKSFIEDSISHNEESYRDPKIANTAFDRMCEQMLSWEQSRSHDEVQRILTELAHHRHPAVQLAAAGFLLWYDVKTACEILDKLDQLDNPRISFNAHMMLEEWKAGRCTKFWQNK
jgi:hypothetical protein